MKQGEFYLWTLRPPVGDNRPVTGKAEGQLAGNRHDILSEPAFLCYFQQTEEEQRFVRSRALSSVDVQVREFVKEVFLLAVQKCLMSGANPTAADIVTPRNYQNTDKQRQYHQNCQSCL